MGVLGLTPFLQKTCPEVVISLPDRFSALSGKRLVIDGTLMTQRFHFAPMPQKYRHVLSWYRLVSQLRQHNIETICVFDGDQRNLAKEREIQRRRKDRMVTAVRAQFEVDRLSRLHRLTTYLEHLDSSEPDKSQKEISALRSMIKPLSMGLAAGALSAGVITVGASAAVAAGAIAIPAVALPVLAMYMASRRSRTPSQSSELPTSHNPLGKLEASQLVEDSINTKTLDALQHEALTQLFAEYRQSIPQLASLSGTVAPRPMTEVTEPEPESDAGDDELMLSKNQLELLEEEGQFWEQLLNSGDLNVSSVTPSQLANALEAKSSVLSGSYLRRTRGPTFRTYEESKEILQSMGVPCIEATDLFEGEALAASLVVHGHADLVASEDTDVLIYEAPLVRNVGNTAGPLVLISGADVRDALQLDREAFVDFALLLGTDFSQRIKNVGPARALKFIRQHRTIERVLEQESKYAASVVSAEYLERIGLARQIFGKLPPPPDPTQLHAGPFNEQAILDILTKYNLRRYASEESDYSYTLSGNYFADSPTAA